MVAEATMEPVDLAQERWWKLPAAIPEEDDFDSDFMASDELDEIGMKLIERYPELEHLTGVRIGYCWKKSGGETNGKATLGKCTKPSGLLLFYAHLDFVIWCAADHCAEWSFTNRQLEALLYHELSHAGIEVDKQGMLKYVVRPHDVEAFTGEVDRYGLWRDDLTRAKLSFDQAALPGFGQ